MVLARHGARSPFHIVPFLGEETWDRELFNVPHKVQGIHYTVRPLKNEQQPPNYDHKTRLPCGAPGGTLTTNGYLGNFNIGKYIKERYGRFESHQVYIRSTNTTRTKESARAIFAGIVDGDSSGITIEVGGRAHNEWLSSHASAREANKNFSWLLEAGGMCDDIGDILRDVLDVVDVGEYNPPEALPTSVKEAAKLFPQFNPVALYDDLTARMEHGIPIRNITQEKLKEIYPLVKRMTFIALNGISGISRSEKEHGLSIVAGRLLDFILEDLKDKPLSILSTHDTTLLPMMDALTFNSKSNERFPPYSSHIDFEFLEDSTGTEYVRILYDTKVIPIKGKEIISLEQFYEDTEWLRLSRDQWQMKKCQSHSPEPIFTKDEIIKYLADPKFALKYLK